jgi:acyl-CoA thioesterase
MEHIRAYFERDTLAGHLGVELVEIAPGRAVARMAVKEHHFNSYGTVHGGAIFALADVAFAAASNAHGTVAVALNANISFLKAAVAGTLTAEASEVSLGKKIATYAIRITDDDGDAVATFQGMVYRKGEPIVAERK